MSFLSQVTYLLHMSLSLSTYLYVFPFKSSCSKGFYVNTLLMWHSLMHVDCLRNIRQLQVPPAHFYILEITKHDFAMSKPFLSKGQWKKEVISCPLGLFNHRLHLNSFPNISIYWEFIWSLRPWLFFFFFS